MNWRIPVAIAVGVVVLVTIVTAVLNGSLAHTPYIVGLWSVLALIGLALYWAGWSIKQRIAARRNKQV
jgi:hypothetical protein